MARSASRRQPSRRTPAQKTSVLEGPAGGSQAIATGNKRLPIAFVSDPEPEGLTPPAV